MKTFKHKTNGSTMTYKDGCMKIENLVIEGTPNLDYWEEVFEKEEILLKTEDGFNIFEGEDYFFFWTDNKPAIGQQPYKLYNHKAKKLEDNTFWAENARFFGKRENAEKALTYTTAEGGLIKEGQEFYVYDNVRFKCLEGVYGHFKNKKYDGRRFKTKEEVKQLILMSKPCLSLKELLSVWGDTNTLNVYSNSPLFNRFKNLANEKLRRKN